MNGIDKIIARMEADTQAECADIAAQAAAEAEAILARYRAEADKLLREGEARCKVLEHEQVERLEGGSRLACRQRVLAEKQRMLGRTWMVVILVLASHGLLDTLPTAEQREKTAAFVRQFRADVSGTMQKIDADGKLEPDRVDAILNAWKAYAGGNDHVVQ